MHIKILTLKIPIGVLIPIAIKHFQINPTLEDIYEHTQAKNPLRVIFAVNVFHNHQIANNTKRCTIMEETKFTPDHNSCKYMYKPVT